MPEATSGVVLDTHAWIWWVAGAPLSNDAKLAIEAASRSGSVLIPAISVWEVAMLESKGRLSLSVPVREWCRRGLSLPGFSLAEMTPEVAIESCQLPGAIHSDPADRLIVATARIHGVKLVTRDEKLQAYGAAGHVEWLPA